MLRQTPGIDDARWAAIEKTLPKTADRVVVRAQLEQIARDKLTPKQRAFEQEEIAQAYDNLVHLLRKANPDEEFIAELIRRSDTAKNSAAFHRRQTRPRLLRQWRILLLWQDAGGDLGYKTAPRKPRGEAKWPEPRGAVIPFFQAAWKAVSGEALSAKTVRDIVVVYQNGMKALKAAKIAVNAEVVKAT